LGNSRTFRYVLRDRTTGHLKQAARPSTDMSIFLPRNYEIV
jgi:hypothetical protein